MPANLENSAVATGLEKVNFHSSCKGNAKECSNYHTNVLISHASKEMLKVLQARLQQYMNCELSDVFAGVRKGRGTRDQNANILWVIKKAREFQKTSTYAYAFYWLCQSPWLCGSQQTLENSSRDGNTRPPYLPPEKSVRRSRKQQLEPDMEQWTCSKSGKKYFKAVYIVTLLA